MKKIVWLLLAMLCVACSKDDNEDPPKTPQEMILGEWKMTHRVSSVSGNIARFNPVYGKSGAFAYLTLNANGSLAYFDEDGIATAPIEGEGLYSFTGSQLELGMYWSTYDISVIHKYRVIALSSNELIIQLHYVYCKDHDKEWEFSSILSLEYYRYTHTGATEQDKPFYYNLVYKPPYAVVVI